MSDQTADDLAAGREYIETHGWTTNLLQAADGTVCAVGGLIRGMGLSTDEHLICEDPRVRDAAKALVRALHRPSELRINPVCTVTDYNDEQAEDKQAVLDWFAKAEKIERAGFDPDEQ
jgi:hypothetical protein